MADLTYTLYDTAVFGATVNAESILFQVAQGSDATHTEAFTNSRGAAQLPVGEKFLIRKVFAIPNHAIINADIETIWRNSFLQIRVADFNLLWVPLVMCAYRADYGGHFGQAAAADLARIGRVGMGYDLEDHPIDLPGGTAFRVRVLQGPAVAANSNVIIGLHGVLTVG